MKVCIAEFETVFMCTCHSWVRMRGDGKESPLTAVFVIGAHLAAMVASMLVAGVNLLSAESERVLHLKSCQ